MVLDGDPRARVPRLAHGGAQVARKLGLIGLGVLRVQRDAEDAGVQPPRQIRVARHHRRVVALRADLQRHARLARPCGQRVQRVVGQVVDADVVGELHDARPVLDAELQHLHRGHGRVGDAVDMPDGPAERVGAQPRDEARHSSDRIRSRVTFALSPDATSAFSLSGPILARSARRSSIVSKV